MWKLQYENVDYDNKPLWEDSSHQLGPAIRVSCGVLNHVCHRHS